jgi:hypothetical protein
MNVRSRDDWDDWDWLSYATDAGWKDPDITEPLERTVARARKYLEAMELCPHGKGWDDCPDCRH